MKRINKWVTEYIVQGNYGYGHGWEDLCSEETYRDGRAQLECYNENEPAPHRLIARRVLNPEYVQPCS